MRRSERRKRINYKEKREGRKKEGGEKMKTGGEKQEVGGGDEEEQRSKEKEMRGGGGKWGERGEGGAVSEASGVSEQTLPPAGGSGSLHHL